MLDALLTLLVFAFFWLTWRLVRLFEALSSSGGGR
jgi:hypothetical protein